MAKKEKRGGGAACSVSQFSVAAINSVNKKQLWKARSLFDLHAHETIQSLSSRLVPEAGTEAEAAY